MRRGTLTDKNGLDYSYELSVEGDCRAWTLFDQKARIGYAWCLLVGREFQLNDLKIAEVHRPRSVIRRLLGRPPEILSYRQRGIGTQLLFLIIAHARMCGAERIIGRIAASDSVMFPGLVQWYQRYGFTFIPTPQRSPLMGEIELRL